MNEISQIKKRFLQYIDSQGIERQEVFDKLGFSKWNFVGKSQNSELGGDKIREISLYFPHLSMEWLITGKGDIMKNNEAATEFIAEKNFIPLIPIEAVAGFSGIDYGGVIESDCEYYHIPDFIASKVEYLIRVSGTSMYPLYNNGDILGCRRVPSLTFYQWGRVYVIDSIQGAMVKRLFECPNNPDSIICKSDNEKYPSFELPKSEIRSLSIVVGIVKLE